MGDCCLCGSKGGGGGFITVVGWTGLGVVHAYPSDQCSLTAGVTYRGQEVCCRDVDGCKVGGACCAVGEGAGYNSAVDCVCSLWGPVGVLFIPKGRLKGECISLKPVKQCQGAKDARIGILWRMDMCV